MQSKIGEIYEGSVTGLTNFGAFIKLENGDTGMVHISEVAPVYVKDINEFLSEGQSVKVKVLTINENKISLSIKQAQPPKKNEASDNFARRPGKSAYRDEKSQPSRSSGSAMSFEDMMAKFKADSEEKMSDLKRSTDMGSSRRRGNK
ncbi:MAG: S1 RNA-binding domain-containing protein [Oscillospiraceae bacterium]|nr:S1 RNA-binding domain-containing protein [Oscillospiraceae bacterium]